MIGAAWRSRAAQALLGPDRSALIPSTLWVGWLDATDTLVAMSGTSYPASAFTGFGDGVTTTQTLDGGVAGTGWAIKAVALYDAATSGSIVASASLPAPVTPTSGASLRFVAGALSFVAV